MLAKGYTPEFVPPRRRRSIDVDNFDKCVRPLPSTIPSRCLYRMYTHPTHRPPPPPQHNREFTTEPAVDSVVQTTLDARQQEMANFEGFTYDDRHKHSRMMR